MNQEFNFEIIPFKIDSEFQDEMFEAEGKFGRSRRSSPQRPKRSPAFSPARPKKPPVKKPRPSGIRSREPWGVIREPYPLVSEPYSNEPEPSGSERVRWVQDSLNRILGLGLPVTGVIGPETRSAIRSFQKQKGLPVSGIVGPDTEKALLDAAAPSTELEQVWNASSIPQSFLSDEFDFTENELDFGSPLTAARKVRANFVSCHPPNADIKAITGSDPVGTIQKANTRAIKLLDKVISELQTTRNKIIAGATPASPTISAAVAKALKDRFHMNVNNRNIWTQRGSGTVYVLIRRFRGARQILADGWMKYTCLGGATVNLKGCSTGSCDAGTRALSCGGNSRIVLCKPWWSDNMGIDKLDAQARTILHECFHIYFGFIGDEGILVNAHCYDQFVLDLNGVAVPADRIGRCP